MMHLLYWLYFRSCMVWCHSHWKSTRHSSRLSLPLSVTHWMTPWSSSIDWENTSTWIQTQTWRIPWMRPSTVRYPEHSIRHLPSSSWYLSYSSLEALYWKDSFAMLIGVVVGIYSSVFIASPIMYDLDKNHDGYTQPGNEWKSCKEKNKRLIISKVLTCSGTFYF